MIRTSRLLPLFLLAMCLLLTGPVSADPFRILVCNDDGVDSEGILALVKALEPIASVTVVAPDKNHSGAGHALTVDGPVLVKEVKREGRTFYSINATPASCVKFALGVLLDKQPDLVVTGINEGHNLGRVVLVSGTFNAAQEAVLQGIPGIALSLLRSKGKEMDYTPGAEFARVLVEALMKQGFPQDVVLNVNIPACSREELKGVALADLSDFQWKEVYLKRKTPWGQTYIWQTIRRPSRPALEGTDEWACDNNMIAVTPVSTAIETRIPMREFKKYKISFDGKTMK